MGDCPLIGLSDEHIAIEWGDKTAVPVSNTEINKRHKKSLCFTRGFVNWLGLEPKTLPIKKSGCSAN